MWVRARVLVLNVLLVLFSGCGYVVRPGGCNRRRKVRVASRFCGKGSSSDCIEFVDVRRGLGFGFKNDLYRRKISIEDLREDMYVTTCR